MQAESRTVHGTDKLRAAESRLLKDINRICVRNGPLPLRSDKRTSDAARSRSVDMATKRYFAHVEPDGDDASRILGRRGVEAKMVTENIGHTIGSKLMIGSRPMARWWYRSPPHRRQMLARGINDKPDPRIVIDEVTVSDDGRLRTIDWRGFDQRLAAGRSGIRRYDLERLAPFGGWDRVGGSGRSSELTILSLGDGDDLLRIRAVDRAGNVGTWAYTRVGTGAADARFM